MLTEFKIQQELQNLKHFPSAEPSGRRFKKLRLSVLPACNFNCVYCDPEENHSSASEKSFRNILSCAELSSIVRRIHQNENLSSVRITGGEPLLYRHLPELIHNLKDMQISSVALTTNGSRLSEKLPDLIHAGLDSVNISLDATHPETFLKMSGGRGSLDDVLSGIESALSAGIPLKLNATLVKGINHFETIPLLDFAISKKIPLRYIELMEMGPLYGRMDEKLFSEKEILSEIHNKYKFTALRRGKSSTARYFRISDHDYSFGIISNMSSPFCSDCDRLRLSSDGKVFGCLSDNRGFSVLGADDADFAAIMKQALLQKKKDGFQGSSLSMKDIGG